MTKTKSMKSRYIVHIDMDAFFAAIEQRDDPGLIGKPVVVGADPKGGRGRGVVSTCSYEARKYGIRSAMPISLAYHACPSAHFLPVDMDRYEAVSEQIWEILANFSPDVEVVSIDEAFLDISSTYHLFAKTPSEVCRMIKASIREKTSLIASCGLAPTKMAAKIASDLKKPDGMVEVTSESLLDFLWPLGVRRLWGLGPKKEATLHSMQITTIGELAARNVDELDSIFGKNGRHLWLLANGIDDSPVESFGDAKSLSNEITFEEDTGSEEKIRAAIAHLSERVTDRLRSTKLKGGTVTLKIRLHGFKTYTRSGPLRSRTALFDDIHREAQRLYASFNRKGERVRLVGVKISNFTAENDDPGLFGAFKDTKTEMVVSAVDAIKFKFGHEAIFRASGKM